MVTFLFGRVLLFSLDDSESDPCFAPLCSPVLFLFNPDELDLLLVREEVVPFVRPPLE